MPYSLMFCKKNLAKKIETRLKQGQSLKNAVSNHIKCEQRKVSKVKKRIETMFNSPFLYFITFTISDKHINKSFKTLTNKIKQSLDPASSWGGLF